MPKPRTIKFKIRSKDQSVRAYYFRGMVIDAFIYLEDEISACLAEFFSGKSDYYWQFMSVVADRMTFEAKRASLKYLMEKLEKKAGFIKTKNNHYKCRDFFNELRLLNDQRNRFAHYICYGLMGRKDLDKNMAIILSDERDDCIEYFYTEDDIKSLLTRIGEARSEVQRIYLDYRESTEAVPDED